MGKYEKIRGGGQRRVESAKTSRCGKAEDNDRQYPTPMEQRLSMIVYKRGGGATHATPAKDLLMDHARM